MALVHIDHGLVIGLIQQIAQTLVNGTLPIRVYMLGEGMDREDESGEPPRWMRFEEVVFTDAARQMGDDQPDASAVSVTIVCGVNVSDEASDGSVLAVCQVASIVRQAFDSVSFRDAATSHQGHLACRGVRYADSDPDKALRSATLTFSGLVTRTAGATIENHPA